VVCELDSSKLRPEDQRTVSESALKDGTEGDTSKQNVHLQPKGWQLKNIGKLPTSFF
jgi:hypothetical protein